MDERQKNVADSVRTEKDDGSTVTIKIDSRMTQRMNLPPIHMAPRILEATSEDSFEKEPYDHFGNQKVLPLAAVMSASASPKTVPMGRAPPPPPRA